MILDFLRSNPDLIVAVGGTLLGWLGLGRKKRSAADIARTIAAALRAEVARLIASPKAHDQAARALSVAAHDALHRVGVKPSKLRDRLVALAVEEALAELEERVIAHNLKTLIAAADRVPAAFTPKGT